MRRPILTPVPFCAALLIAAMSMLWSAAAQAQAITIDQRRDLLFGRVGTGDISGTVTITASGGKTTTGGVIDLGQNHRAARFRIEGPKDALVIVTLPTTATVSGGGRSATLSNFTMDQTNPIDLGRSGRATIDVGATLSLGTNLPAATYSGSFVIYVDPQ